MTLSDLSERTGISKSRLEKAHDGKSELADDEISLVANALGVPERALFSKEALPLSNIPDFRRNNPRPALLAPEIVKAIGFIEKISLSFASLNIDLNLDSSVEEYDGPLNKKSAQSLARKWRKRWGVSGQKQIVWASANKLYSSLRDYIEGLGIFVLHYSFGIDSIAGLYSKLDDGPHVILINTTKSSKARKLFTLAHEFCHVLLRKVGISNPSILKNNIETFCNQFAAYLVAPDNVVAMGVERYGYTISLDNESIRLLANNIGISQQACILRLIDLEYLEKSAYARWMSRFDSVVPDGDQTDGSGGGGNSDPIKNKITHYGKTFLSKLAYAHKKGLLDQIEIYRLAGIKPKYQQQLLGV